MSRLHGYHGAIVIFTPTGKESSLEHLNIIWIGTSSETARSYSVQSASWMPKGWKLEVSGISSEETAKLLVGLSVFADRSSLPSLEQNEFYLSDLLELTAYDNKTQEMVGKFIALEESSPDGQIKTSCWVFETINGPLSIPAVAHFIHSVDLKKKVIWLHNLEDLP